MPSRTAADISPALWKQYRPFRSIGSTQVSPDSLKDAQTAASSLAKELKARFGASKVMLFGSLGRGDFHQWSDIDLAIWGITPADFYRAAAFASGFSEVFKVDLVDADDCPESLRQHIQKEGIEL